MGNNAVGVRIFLIAIAAVAGIGIIWLWLASPGWMNAIMLALAVIILLSLATYVVVTFRIHTRPRRLPASHSTSRGYDPEGIDYFFDSNGPAALSVAQAMTYIDAVVYPREVFERISEQAESFHRSLMLKSTYTVSVHRKTSDADSAPDYVIPLFLFPKGELQDGLRVFTGEKDRVSTLSTTDVVVFSAAVVRSLLFAAGGKAYKNYLSALEEEVISAFTSSSAPSQSDLNQLRARIVGLDADAGKLGLLNTAASLVSDLAIYHPICVTIPVQAVQEREWPWTFRFRLEYRTIPLQRALGSEPWWQRLAVTLRLALGVRLNRLFIPIPNATRTRSFHLQVAGPAGTYLARQGTIPREEDLIIKTKQQPRRGQRRAHLYVRELTHDAEVFFATQFYERAPGSFASTTASAWAAAIVIAMLAIQQIASFQSGTQPVLSTLLPALLAVPIAVASWNKGELARQLLHPSLLSRTLTFGTIALSLAAFAAAVAPRQYFVLPANVWVLLAVLAVVLGVISTFSWIIRLAFEHHFTRSVDEAQ